ncbi:helix-turn-helix transcriptional regulator [Vibrio parahaemolyticus]|uniref:helix-turn-helix transcriptional regulator n=1 Tax=Vibrio parahaemolyticus TaxID=670 RepID=UPI0003FF4381|nr:transcriptional regulator [Vibrio parahaemolyticus]
MAKNHYDYSREMTKGGNIHIISKKALAEKLERSLSTISRMIDDGRLPEPLRTPKGNVGGWLAPTIENWLQQRTG